MSVAIQRAQVEQIVRQLVYKRLGLKVPRIATAPHPLVVNVSARHCHLTQEAVEALFGKGYKLTVYRWLYQEGQFAANETVTLIGPRSRVISNLRILGPCRNLNQVELSLTDAISLGFEVPLRLSGDIEDSPGCMLMGPAGFYQLDKGVIRAMRHVHMGPEDAEFYGVKDGDEVKLKVGGPCALIFEKVVVRVGKGIKLEVHLDTDEANACMLRSDTPCELIV